MLMIRRLARGIAVLAVALAAGHLVQTMTAEQQAAMNADTRPKQVEQVSAGAEAVAPQPLVLPDASAAPTPAAPTQTTAAAIPAAPLPVPAEPVPVLPEVMATTPPAAPVLADTASTVLAAATPEVTPAPPSAPVAPVLLPTDVPDTAAAVPAPTAPVDPAPVVADACAATLDLIPEAEAMIGLSLVAPCNTDERVVLRHAGLAITGRTTATGSLFLSIPALQGDAEVSVLFADQSTVTAEIQMPELAGLRRFGVQWMADDAFQLQALEKGAGYGTPGHISAANPRLAVTAATGALSLLGDAAVDRPMLAQIYTYPTDSTVPVDVIVEAEVTETTCNRDLIGETITSVGGEAFITELTVATPACDAVGDILLLKNLVPDLKIAAN